MFDKSQILQVMSQILFGLLGAVILQLFFIHHNQKIVTVDITGIVKSFETEALKQKLSADELSFRVKQFGGALNAAVDSYSSDTHFILVPKEVVIAGALDKTNEIKKIIKMRLKS